ncbi:MAG: hypothetical protein ACRD3N_05545 [Terracidiphilus sp.]
MIRQAITCDICASEKKQTNHWFVAYEQSGELRVSGWSTRNRLRTGTKHLCGQTCLHKLVDDFMARAVASRLQSAATEDIELFDEAEQTDASLTSNAAFGEFESSARLIAAPVPVHAASVHAVPAAPARSFKPAAELVTMPERFQSEPPARPPVEAPRYSSRTWRAEAWEREREREGRASAHHPEVARRRSSA